MDNWLELERRFRDFASREPDVRLFATEGDNGTAYHIGNFNSKSAERELEALASQAGKLLHDVGASRCASRNPSDFAKHWWRYLKNNSRDVFCGAHGYSRQSPDSEPRHHQTGLLQNVGMTCASECAILHTKKPAGRHPIRAWFEENIIKVAVTTLVGLVLGWLWAKWTGP